VISGTTTSLRPSGIGRYVGAVFLSVWLVGWVIGEVIALAALVWILASIARVLPEQLSTWGRDLMTSGGIAFIVFFLAIWLTFWTIGGVSAITHVLRSLAGEDIIALSGSGLDLVRRAGPFRKRYTLDRSAIRRIRIRPHDKAVVADVDGRTQVLTTFGSVPEREAIRNWLDAHLQLPGKDAADRTGTPPAEWEVIADVETTRLRKVRPRARLIRSLIAWGLTAVMTAVWVRSVEDTRSANLPALSFVLLLGAGAAVSAWGRREWIVRHGELTFRRTFLTWRAERAFRDGRLEVTHKTDSDNDSHYTLIVADGQGRSSVHSQMNDSMEVVDLGHWLAARTGFPLK
jgi:hypothetical protein